MPDPREGVTLRALGVYVWSESAREILAWDLDLIRFAEARAIRWPQEDEADPAPDAD